jgi:lathosterol oxidase
MDVIVDHLDHLVLDQMYSHFPESFHVRDNWARQYVTSYLLLWIGGSIMYFVFAFISYVTMFDRAQRNDKRFIKNQEFLEISVSLKSIPLMAFPSAVIFMGELRGWSKLHDEPLEGVQGWVTITISILAYLFFTDMMIYWIHRWLHHPLLYKPIHKLHHKWVVTTPFASHAFHPMDGFLQSTPYHIYVYLFPLNKWLYLFLFVFVNFWTISIHDGSGFYAGDILNGADHHTIHHRAFNYNYGQYFTLWDRLCGTHRLPTRDNINISEKPHGVKDE